MIDILWISNAPKRRVIAIMSKKSHPNPLIRKICSSRDLYTEKKEKHSSLLDSASKNSSITKSSDYYTQFVGISERDAKWIIRQQSAKRRIAYIITSRFLVVSQEPGSRFTFQAFASRE